MEEQVIKKGGVLLAEPFMLDPNFKRAAVFLVDHHEEGSLGFVMNKPINMQINDLVESFPDFKAEVRFGGPVQTNTIHYLHNLGGVLDDSVEVAEGVYWGGDFDKLKFLVRSDYVRPENIRFFVGYAGWGEGQLEEELRLGSWVTADMDPNYLFKLAPDELWGKIMHNKGTSFSILATLPDSISWN